MNCFKGTPEAEIEDEENTNLVSIKTGDQKDTDDPEDDGISSLDTSSIESKHTVNDSSDSAIDERDSTSCKSFQNQVNPGGNPIQETNDDLILERNGDTATEADKTIDGAPSDRKMPGQRNTSKDSAQSGLDKSATEDPGKGSVELTFNDAEASE